MPTLTDEQIAQILEAAGPRQDAIRRILGEDLDSEPEPVKEEEEAEEESSDEEESSSEE